MNECVFCKIVEKEIPAEIVFENKGTLTFLDIAPHAPGHAVVIPVRHAEALTDLSDEEGNDFFQAIRVVDRALLRATQAEGMTIGVNQGAIAGQAVPHLHAHLMPRFSGDGGGSVHGVVNNPPKESMAIIAAKIRTCMPRENIVH